jgi:hypothetical protein
MKSIPNLPTSWKIHMEVHNNQTTEKEEKKESQSIPPKKMRKSSM